MDRKRLAAPPPGMAHKRLPNLSTKVVDAAEGIVESIVSLTGNVDDGNDRIMAGAFTKTLTERGRRLKVLNAHNTNSVLDIVGKALEVREVSREQLPPEVLAEFPDATGGLYAKTQFLIGTPEGKGVYDRIAAGAAFEWSIGYDPITTAATSETRDGHTVRVRNLKEVRLWEYSPVIWGMNPGTATMSAKDAAAAATSGVPVPTPDPEPDAAPKEMVIATGASIEYPIQRLGDVLYGATRCAYMTLLDSWLVQGILSVDEHSTLVASGDEDLANLLAGIPQDVGSRQVCYYGAVASGYMAADGPDDSKAGRVLSGTNATAIRGALTTLQEVLRRAGVYDADADEEDGKGSSKAAGPHPPRADDAPTDLKSLETLVLLEQAEISRHLVEV